MFNEFFTSDSTEANKYIVETAFGYKISEANKYIVETAFGYKIAFVRVNERPAFLIQWNKKKALEAGALLCHLRRRQASLT
jgi:hypothetical protein